MKLENSDPKVQFNAVLDITIKVTYTVDLIHDKDIASNCFGHFEFHRKQWLATHIDQSRPDNALFLHQ